MDRLGLSRWIVLVLYMFTHSSSIIATYPSENDNPSLMSSMLSKFELKLQETAFDYFKKRESPKSLRKKFNFSGDRRKRDVPNRTAFIPGLNKHREQLVIETINASVIPWGERCNDSKVIRFDAAHYRRKYYTFSICGDLLSLYEITGSTLTLLEQHSLETEALTLSHVKLSDQVKGHVELFILVLTTASINVYALENDHMEAIRSQPLAHNFLPTVSVFYTQSSVYYMLGKAESDGSTMIGIFELQLNNSVVNFEGVEIKTLPQSSMVRMCVGEDGHGYLFAVKKGRHRVHIYQFDSKINKLVHNQVIDTTSEADDISCFRMGATHYAVVVTSGTLRVFQQVDTIYELIDYETFLPGLTSVLPIPTDVYRDEVILLVRGVDPESREQIVDLLTFDPQISKYKSRMGSSCKHARDDWRAVEVRSYNASVEGLSCITRDVIPDWNSLSAGMILDHNPSFIVPFDVAGSKKLVLLTLGTRLDPVASPVLEQKRKIFQKVEEYDSALKTIQNRSNQFEKLLPKLVISGSDVKLHGTSWKAGTLRVTKLTVPEAEPRLSRKIEFNREDWKSFIDVTIGVVVEQVEQLEKLVSSIEKQLEGALVNGTVEPVQLKELLINGSTIIQSLQAENLFLGQLNGQTFNSVLNDTVRRDSDKLIEGLKTLNGMLKTNALTADNVNGIRVDDIVTTEGAHVFGNVEITRPAKIRRNLTVAGKLAEANTDQLLTSEDLHPSLKFTQPIKVEKLVIQGRVNGLDGNEAFFDSILVDGSTDVHLDDAKFQKLLVNGNVTISSEKLCGLNVSDLKKIVRIDTDEVITGTKVMGGNVTMEKSLKASFINSLKIPRDLVYRDQTVMLTTNKTFQGPVQVDSVIINGLVNNRRMRDAITLDTDQEVQGAIVLDQGFEVKNDLQVSNVNGNNYNSLLNVGVHPTLLLARQTNRSVSFRKPVRVDGELEIGSKVNNVSLKDLVDDILYSDEAEPVVTGKKKLRSLTMENVNATGRVNGLNVATDLFTNSTDQAISGTYQLDGPVVLETLNASKLNEYEVGDFIGNLVRLEGLQEISSQLNFDDLIVQGDLKVGRSINGIDISRMLTDGNEQHFTAEQTLVNPKFDALKIVGNLSLEQTKVNHMELNVWDRKRATLSTDQNITGEWKVDQADFKKAKIDSLNQLPTGQWAEDFIRKDAANQVINGNLTVSRLGVKGEVHTREGFNGFRKLNEVAENAFDTRYSVSMGGNAHFERLESTDGNTIVSKNINDVDLQELKEDAIFAANPKSVNGTKTFSNPINVTGNIATDDINGGLLINQYLHVNMDQTIESPIQFEAPVSTEEIRMGSAATFNGLSSDSLFSSDVLPDNIHHGAAVFKSKIAVDDLTTKRINEEDWSQLMSSLAWTNQSNKFPHRVVFKDLKVNGTIQAREINGINFIQWADDIVFADVDATISGRKVFNNLNVSQLQTDAVRSANVRPDLTKAMEEAIRLDRDETIDFEVRFEDVEVIGDVKIDEQLNGRAFPGDYITLSGQQNLSGEYTINHLVASGQIELTEVAMVNGLNLTSEFNDTWMLDRPTQMEWQKTFAGPVEVKTNLNIVRTVNGIDLSNEAVSLQSDSTLYGTPIFHELNVKGNIDNVGLTNDVNISGLASRALYVDEPVVSSGYWKIDTLNMNGDEFLLTRAARINDYDVERLIDLPASEVEEEEELVNDKRLFDAAKHWYDALRSAYFKLDYFEVNQTIDVRYPITSMLNVRLDEDTSVLLVGTQHCSSVVYLRNATENAYIFSAIISPTNSVHKWIPLRINDSVAYVASLSKMTSSCRQNNAKLWRIEKEPLRIELVQDLGRNIVDVASSSLSDDIHFIFTAGDVLKQWTISSRNPGQISSRVLSNSSLTNIISVENQNGIRFSSSELRTHRFNVGEDQLVAFMEPKESSVSGCSGVKIHRHHNDQHLLEHVIQACGVQEMISFTIGNLPDHFVVLAERSKVGVYQYQGSSGFVLKTTLPIPSARSLQWIRQGNEYFLAVGKQGTIVIYKAITLGDFVDS